MSFRTKARRVRDSARPMPFRIGYFNSCVHTLSFLTEQDYHNFLAGYILPKDAKPTETELLASLDALEQLREQYLIRRNAFIQRRLLEKREGRRRPRKKDLEELRRFTLPPEPLAPE